MHCNQPLLRHSDNPAYFTRKCAICGKVFKQRKRQKGVKGDIGPRTPRERAFNIYVPETDKRFKTDLADIQRIWMYDGQTYSNSSIIRIAVRTLREDLYNKMRQRVKRIEPGQSFR